MAFFNNLFKKVQKFTGYTKFLEDKMEQFVERRHLSEFQKIVAPFETEIPFHVVRIDNNGDTAFHVEPIPGIMFTRDNSLPDPGEFETASLFYVLNDGLENRRALMPDDFDNETSPNSLQTSYKNYSRNRILVKKRFRFKIEPRNWVELVEQKYRNEMEHEFEGITKQFFKSFIKR